MGRKDDLIYAKALLESYLKYCTVPEFGTLFQGQLDKVNKELGELDETDACPTIVNCWVCRDYSAEKCEKAKARKKDKQDG